VQQYEQIYRLYFRDIYLYLCSLTRDEALAEELTAEVFARAIASLHKFRGECDLRVWLCQIAKNCWLTHCRHRGREAELPAQEPADDTCTIEQTLENRDVALRLHQYLHTMPEPYKEVFTLRVFCELPFAQIAALFGKTESWARVTYHRARRKLQQWSEEQEDGQGEL